MAEDGIDITAETPKILTTDAVRASDVVITMGCGDTCPIFPGKRYEDWVLDDPAWQRRGVRAPKPRRHQDPGPRPARHTRGSRRRLGGSAHGHFTSSTVPLHSGLRAHETHGPLSRHRQATRGEGGPRPGGHARAARVPTSQPSCSVDWFNHRRLTSTAATFLQPRPRTTTTRTRQPSRRLSSHTSRSPDSPGPVHFAQWLCHRWRHCALTHGDVLGHRHRGRPSWSAIMRPLAPLLSNERHDRRVGGLHNPVELGEHAWASGWSWPPCRSALDPRPRGQHHVRRMSGTSATVVGCRPIHHGQRGPTTR